jgi:DNA-3-methyladenine glycosylase
VPALPPSYFARDAVVVARELLGCHLVRGSVCLRITETEAYCWPGDSACHARSGRTPRNAALWGPAGHAYVFQCYGVHQMLNVVTGADGEASAVLIRACEPVRGLALVRRRRGAIERGGIDGPDLLRGPGRVGQALAIDLSDSGACLFDGSGLTVEEGPRPAGILRGPRVGIDYALERDRRRPWRFAVADSPWVSRRGELRRG